MTSTSTRRFIPIVAVATWALACGGGDPAADPGLATAEQDVPRTGDPIARGYTEDDFPRVQQIAPGVYTYEALRSAGEERFTTVSMFVVTDEGVVVADGQGNVDQTTHLVETIAGITSQPISWVIICSDHGDHTAGNSAFPESAQFVAHPTSDGALRASAAASRPPESPPIVLPTQLVEESLTLELGGREIQVLFLGRAHTGGDLHVYLPEEKVLFMSEAYLNRIFPAMRSAYPTEWVAMIERAQRMDVDTYVPGHGFVETPGVLEEELETFRQATEQVIAEASRLHAEGLDVDAAAAAAQFGDLEGWSLRSSQGSTAIRRIYLELNGELPPA